MKYMRVVLKQLVVRALKVVSIGVFVGFSNMAESNEKISDELEMKKLDGEVIYIELNGKRFDIPVRYLYGQAIEKYHKWPEAKKERVKVDALTLSVLLPNLRPYYPEDDNLWKVKGHGDRVEVTIRKFRGPTENWEKGIDINRAAVEKNNQLYTRKDSVYGLSRYAGAGHLNDKYFSNERQLEITCDSVDDGLFSPSCHSKSKYIYGIDFEYYYGLNHLPRWREIDDGLKAMFNQLLKTE